jgi:plastocyanin
MNPTPWRSALALALLAGLPASCAPAPGAAASPTASKPAAFEIVASKRAFDPPTLTLRLGEPVTLVVRNEDEDLHAFVPLLLFLRTNVQIAGNGAPEFNETGFARALIPPHGRIELRFTPKTAGTFSYLCDLPGHLMRGEIVVREAAAP